MKNYRKAHRLRALAVVVAATLLAVFFLSSCSSLNANVSNQQESLFAAAPGSPVSIACGPSNVVAGDLNKDSRPDLIVTCGQAPAITVLLGTGGGRGGDFRASTPIPLPDAPGDIALGDVNGDGNLDVALDSHDSYGVVLMLGDGKGGLALAPNSPIVMKEGQHPHTHGLALGDLNGDGKLDLITVNSTENDVSIAYGDGRGGFTRASATFPVGPSPYPFALGDINSDGRLDIIATATATGPLRAQQLPSSFALTLLLNEGAAGNLSKPGEASFRRSELRLRTNQPWFAAIGDLNGDRKPDVVVTHHDQSQLTVLLGDGAGHFTEGASSPFALSRNAFQLHLADVNRDGRLDALAAAGEGVLVMLGDGRGNFKPSPGSPFSTGRGVWRFALGDLNSDSKLDVVTSNLESRSISLLLGR